MPRTKAAPNRVVEFDIGMKSGKVLRVAADKWSVYSTTNTALQFSLHGELVLALYPGKWDYIRRVTPVDRPTVAQEDQ